MEDEMILSRPTDRRLVGDDNLPPGPPGAENDSFELVQKDPKQSKKDHVKDVRDSRRRSPSNPRERRSRSRSRGKLRSRGREYSPPDRRRYGIGIGRGGGVGRRSPRDRIIRSPPPNRNRSRDRINRRRDRHERSRSRDRYRGRRSRSRTNSPMQRRWSPMTKKPPSPALPPPPQYTVPPPQYDAYEAYGNVPYMGQFAAYDYTNQVPVQVPYPPSYPCDPSAWTQQVPPPQQQQQLPAPPQPPQITPIIETDEDQQKRDAAIAQEAQNQRDQLKKQRSDYLKRAAALKREMKILKDQRSDLISTTAPPSPTTKGFLEENDRLESQIQKKLSTIENVIDMLSSIIGEEKQTSAPSPGSKKSKKKSKHNSDMDDDDSSSPERLKSKLIESMKTKRSDGSQKSSDKTVEVKTEKIKDEHTVKTQNETVATKKINYSFYDPEMHWCLTCDVFPKTAKDYLNHLHSTLHMENMITPDTPWHETVVNDEFPVHPNVTTKRTPIRGLQFFVPSAGWFCKLCNYWMGDLHCASAHLKSRTHWDKYNEYIDQNPHFEVDWIADRQKVYDGVRAKDNFPPPPPQITSVSTTGMDLLESIPLQINNQKVLVDIEKPLKKKKKKSDEKKEKKKKKRSKKRKKDSSSSSSSSSESSSESEKEKKQKEDRSNSIRVAMRNLLRNESKEDPKQEVPSRGKWTTVQKGTNEPIGANASSQPTAVQTATKVEVDRRKDELISQWNTPQPIISASEKKLLEDLKGKLKTKASVDAKKADEIESKKRERSPVVKPNGNKDKVLKRSRSRDRRSQSKNRLDRRSKSRERRSRSADNGRSRDRRSRSRDRGRGRMSPDRRRRRSRSQRRSRSPRRRSRSPNRYGRRRSYSRSRSRSKSHRIEKPIVRYPEFRPRVPPPESKKSSKNKSENDTDRKKSPSSKKSSSQTGKRLPFIGRMPVFKKQPQGSDGEKKEGEMAEEGVPTNEQMPMAYDHYDNMGMMMDYDDLMPDPMQFVSLMGAPPPPPSGPPPVQHAEEKDMLPPGIDESEADNVPKPISDAPIPRKGPLPKDFQEALNIIFPGEKKPDEPPANKEDEKEVEADNGEKEEPRQPEDIQIVEEMSIEATSIHTDDASQQSVNETFTNYPSIPMLSLADLTSFGGKTVPDTATNLPSIEIEGQTFLGLSAALTSAPPPPPPSPPRTPEHDQAPPRTPEHDQATNQCDSIVPDESNGNDSQNNASPKESANDRRQEELDDLAMLGIDADDLAAQCM